MSFGIRIKNHILYDLKIVNRKYCLQIRKMSKRNCKSFKLIKLMLLVLCVVIVLTVITVGLVKLWSQKSKESTPKRNESLPKEKDVKSILSFIKIFIFFCLKILFLN